MSFNWSDYLDVARDLARLGATHTSREAESRSAISRAYYAAFCTSRNRLRDIDHEPLVVGSDVHAAVQNLFLSSSNRTRATIGANLSRLRRLRNKADYDVFVSDLSREVSFALHLAEDIISDLRRL